MTNADSLKHLIQTLRPEIDAALAEIAKKRGMQSLKLGKCVYNPDANNFEFKLAGIAADGVDKDAARLTAFAKYDEDFPKLGDEFDHPSYGVCVVTGTNTTGTKIKAKTPKDGVRLWKTEDAKRMVDRKKGIAPKPATDPLAALRAKAYAAANPSA